ncbi:MAG: Hsp70 family protein [Acidobacteria bacterium]|jgi:molecular chaperone DnaK (HSP70)|nr:Hsp70 family protein [Acidobacteriota bacterium]
MAGWALDLGTTNSGVARWDEDAGQPQLVELPEICRRPWGTDPLEAPRLVPSAVHLLERPGLLDRLGTWRPIARRFFLGHTALIGRKALDRNRDAAHPAFVPAFKPALAYESLRPLARVGRRGVTAREAARAFLRELLREVKSTTGHRIRDLVVTSPVSAFETYRAEVQGILRRLGVRRLRFLDEPVAAALGYGLSLSRERLVLVVDIGGGTMHVVLVRLSPRGSMAGEAQVLAKQARPLGGHAVDGWVLMSVCEEMAYPLLDSSDDEDTRFWRRVMLAEACRVKEAVFFDESAIFRVTPPGLLSLGDRRRPGSGVVTVTRDRLGEILTERGFYRALEHCLEEVFDADSAPARVEDVEEVLLVGGSTLLPGVFGLLEKRFERRRLRAWQPFEAVAYGAASFAADHMSQLDFIVHDYAFVTHHPKTGEAQHTVIVPRGTRFPTRLDLWKRQVVPTCALGEPEHIFKLVICEVARSDGHERRFVWDAAGDLHKVGGTGGGERQVVVPLNEASPTLGYLDPPHQPGDRRPRLEIAFGVNAERWLVATVRDLLSGKSLLDAEAVVRLM